MAAVTAILYTLTSCNVLLGMCVISMQEWSLLCELECFLLYSLQANKNIQCGHITHVPRVYHSRYIWILLGGIECMVGLWPFLLGGGRGKVISLARRRCSALWMNIFHGAICNRNQGMQQWYIIFKLMFSPLLSILKISRSMMDEGTQTSPNRNLWCTWWVGFIDPMQTCSIWLFPCADEFGLRSLSLHVSLWYYLKNGWKHFPLAWLARCSIFYIRLQLV